MGLFATLFNSKAKTQKIPPEGTKPAPRQVQPLRVVASSGAVPASARTAQLVPKPISGAAALQMPKPVLPRSITQRLLPMPAALPPPRAVPTAAAEDESPGNVTLTLADILPRVRVELLNGNPADLTRKLRFPLAALSAELARGRAAVPLVQIREQCPEIFRDSVELLDGETVRLPLQKLLEQIGHARRAGTGAAPQLPPASLPISNPPVAESPVIQPRVVDPPVCEPSVTEPTTIAEAAIEQPLPEPFVAKQSVIEPMVVDQVVESLVVEPSPSVQSVAGPSVIEPVESIQVDAPIIEAPGEIPVTEDAPANEEIEAAVEINPADSVEEADLFAEFEASASPVAPVVTEIEDIELFGQFDQIELIPATASDIETAPISTPISDAVPVELEPEVAPIEAAAELPTPPPFRFPEFDSLRLVKAEPEIASAPAPFEEPAAIAPIFIPTFPAPAADESPTPVAPPPVPPAPAFLRTPSETARPEPIPVVEVSANSTEPTPAPGEPPVPVSGPTQTAATPSLGVPKFPLRPPRPAINAKAEAPSVSPRVLPPASPMFPARPAVTAALPLSPNRPRLFGANPLDRYFSTKVVTPVSWYAAGALLGIPGDATLSQIAEAIVALDGIRASFVVAPPNLALAGAWPSSMQVQNTISFGRRLAPVITASQASTLTQARVSMASGSLYTFALDAVFICVLTNTQELSAAVREKISVVAKAMAHARLGASRRRG